MRSSRIVRVLLSLTIVLALAGLQASPAEASTASKLKALIVKVLHAKNPKTAWAHLTKTQRAQIKKELTHPVIKHKTTTVPIPSTNSQTSPMGASSTDCTVTSYYTSAIGRSTGILLYAIGNTTKVCVSNRWVVSVNVVVSYTDSGLGWHPDTIKDYTLDVGWEGRGMTRGTFWWGVGPWRIFEVGDCAQVRINATTLLGEGRPGCTLS